MDVSLIKGFIRQAYTVTITIAVLISSVALMSGSVRICAEEASPVVVRECGECCKDSGPLQTEEPAECCITEAPPAIVPAPQQPPVKMQLCGVSYPAMSIGLCEAYQRTLLYSKRDFCFDVPSPEYDVLSTILRC